MKSNVDHCKKSRGPHAAVLMARLVDPQARGIHPAAIRSIDYTLFEVANGRRKWPVRGHRMRRLDIDEVVLPGLQNDASWDVDCSGYNFRHEIFVARPRIPTRGGDTRYELVYFIENVTGEFSFVSFQVRLFCHD
jgi:hypothetical protein